MGNKLIILVFLFINHGFCIASQSKNPFMENNEPTTIEADGSIEFDDQKNMVRAYENVTLQQKDSTLWADRVDGFFQEDNDKKKSLVRLEAFGHVKIKMPGKTAASEEGVYDVEKEIVFLKKNVKITDGKNQLTGEYGTLNLKTNQSRLFNSLEEQNSGQSKSSSHPKKRVKILLIPNSKKKPQTP